MTLASWALTYLCNGGGRRRSRDRKNSLLTGPMEGRGMEEGSDMETNGWWWWGNGKPPCSLTLGGGGMSPKGGIPGPIGLIKGFPKCPKGDGSDWEGVRCGV